MTVTVEQAQVSMGQHKRESELACEPAFGCRTHESLWPKKTWKRSTVNNGHQEAVG